MKSVIFDDIRRVTLLIRRFKCMYIFLRPVGRLQNVQNDMVNNITYFRTLAEATPSLEISQ